ncbi:hypothetical protein D3C75_1302210 [compost metagenome]
MHDANRLDAVTAVGAQMLFDHLRIDPAAPAFDSGPADELRLEAQAQRHLLPEGSEMAGFEHQHFVACTQCVAQRRFPGTCA